MEDTTYITIMLVVFLVVTCLAIDVGYMYVSEEDLQGTAETAALAGAEAIKQQMLFQARTDAKNLKAATADLVQPQARAAAVEAVSGKHAAAALMALANNNGNALTEDNDVTVGFWDAGSRTYTAGATPVNAIQVRTRRTAESASVGLGSLGSFFAKITGSESFGSTPVAIAAIPPGTRANVAICSDAGADASCSFPEVCTLAERRLTAATPTTDVARAGSDHYLYTSLLHPPAITNTMSDIVCQEMPQQEVCGGQIYTAASNGNAVLRDIKAMMYDPKVDSGNKEIDKNGKVVGWWTVLPVTDCVGVKGGDAYEQRAVSKYALVRITRICASGPPGCGRPVTSAGAPAGACAAGDEGIYIDRISSVSCGSKTMKEFSGLHPVLVGQ